jgi:AbrB family looped-hinge helix DNA binding protein
MAEVITIGEKGQIVIPRKIRFNLHLEKGSQLIITEEKEKVILKPIKLDAKHAWMLLSEKSLKKVWDNPYDERWDDVL